MTEAPSTTPIAVAPLDVVTRLLHLGLAVFGVWSWLDGLGWIGAGASDYDNPVYSGYIQHRWVGIVFTVFLLAVIEHWHQIGNVLVPAYLILHVGGTVSSASRSGRRCCS